MANEETKYKDMYSKSRRNALPPGTQAPDFTLRSTPDQWLTLSEFSGEPVVLAFYPADWSPVCGDQMTLYNEMLEEFHNFGAELIGISVDGAWCHAAFARDRKLHFPLLADFEPKGEVPRQRWRERASTFRDRCRRQDSLELRFAVRRKSRSRWNSFRTGRFAEQER